MGSTLTLIDISGVQDYVFASGRLRDAVGASALIERTLFEGLAHAGWSESETLQAAGGVACLRSVDREAARTRTARLTRWMLEHAPGLEATCVHQDIDADEMAAYRELTRRMARAKLGHAPSVPLDRLPVVAACARTSLPAAERVEQALTGELDDGKRELLSPRVAATRRRATADQKREPVLTADGAPGLELAFPLELDALGRTSGVSSFIGVVHVDGNRVGRRIRRWQDARNARLTDLSHWSAELAAGVDAAFVAVRTAVLANIKTDDRAGTEAQDPRPRFAPSTGPEQLHFDLDRLPRDRRALPLRPILLGGDDLTFVCDGRIALSLARVAIEAMAKIAPEHLGGEPLTACAGVAIVPVHAPFAGAYALSAALTRSAKALSRTLDDAPAIDWHVGLPRASSLAEVRRREYGGSDGAMATDDPRPWLLTRRPYPLHGDDLSLDWLLDDLLDGPDGLRVGWAERRGKAKELRRLVRQGHEALASALRAWSREEQRRRAPEADPAPWFPAPIEAGRGFVAGRTPLLDAIELIDLHLPVS